MEQQDLSGVEKKIDKLIELNTGMLETLRRMSDVNELKITQLEKEIKEIKADARDSASARKEIYGLIDAIGRRCSGIHGNLDERRPPLPNDTESGKIAKWAWAALIGAALGGIGMKIAEKLF